MYQLPYAGVKRTIIALRREPMRDATRKQEEFI